MENLDINKLIVVDTLPKIIEQLDILGNYIDEGLKDIDKLECNEENKQIVKKKRTEINNTLKVLEDKRKEIKSKILEPYAVFEDKFNNVAKIKLQNASDTLGNKINEIENSQKEQKTQTLKEFAQRQFESNGIQDIVTFDDIGLNITLSASEKSLKDQIIEFSERIKNELETIMLEEFKDEIMVEYKKCLNYTQAKQIVLQRHKEIEEAQQQREIIENNIQQEKEFEKAVEEFGGEIITPQEIKDEEEIITVTFTIKETRNKLKLLKEFLVNNNIKYE